MPKEKKNEEKELLMCPDPNLPPTYYRKDDLEKNFSWQIFRIMAEFVDGFQLVAKTRKAVTIFGGTKIKRGSYYYLEAEKLGRLLAEHKVAVVTGGGPGIMEAANKGAFEAGGKSIGLNILLPVGERSNPYLTDALRFNYFFTRKTIFSFIGKVYVFFPGGFGTLDEFFNMLALVQTRKISPAKHKIVVIGEDFWGPLLTWIKKDLREKWETINPEDPSLIKLVNSAEEAFEIIKKHLKL